MDLNTLCNRYVAFLRALYLTHQNNHWQSRGDAFFAHHLLFERIYQSAEENADAAAEKMIGLHGNGCVDLAEQAGILAELLKTFSEEENLIIRSLKAENAFQEFSKDFYSQLEDNDILSLGEDDLIMSIANERESAMYLLKQTVGGSDMNKKMSQINVKMSKLADKFRHKIAQVQPNVSSLNSPVGDVDVADVGEMVQNALKAELGLKNDLDFAELRMVTNPSDNQSSISWKMSVPPEQAAEYNAAVARKRQSEPGYSVARRVTQLFNQYSPDTPVLPAQPISIG